MIKNAKLETVNRTEKVETAVLNNINFEENENEHVSIVIPSLSCEKFTFAPIMFNENRRNNLRKSNISFVFQNFNRLQRNVCAIIAMFLFCGCLCGQYRNVVVPAGTKIIDNFPPSMRYLYPEFVQGKIVLKNDKSSSCMVNYNMLQDEIEFLQDNDTLSIVKKKDLKYIIADNDTFIYNSGYVKFVSGQDLKIYCKDKFYLKEILKRDGMGAVNRSAAIESNSSMGNQTVSYDLAVSEDYVYRREISYYIITSNGSIEQLKKQDILNLFSNHKSNIQKYLKDNKIDFQKQEDVVKLAGYLSAL